jgi:hypothetical protein
MKVMKGVTMTKVLRMENDDHYGPFVTMDAAEFAKHVPWAKYTPSEYGPAIETDDDHPHHMVDIPHAEEVNWEDDPMGLLFGDIAPINSKWKVGVKDLDQFYYWFPKQSLDYFASEGFHLSIYDVPNDSIMKGKFQLMFNSKKAKLVEAEDLKAIKE